MTCKKNIGVISMKVKGMGKEEDYPLTYKEYEEKVLELFLDEYNGEELEIMSGRIKSSLDKDPKMIERFYVNDCFTYDNPQIYGDNCKRTFEDEYLNSGVVRQLRMILEG
jgi:hypothetical protein